MPIFLALEIALHKQLMATGEQKLATRAKQKYGSKSPVCPFALSLAGRASHSSAGDVGAPHSPARPRRRTADQLLMLFISRLIAFEDITFRQRHRASLQPGLRAFTCILSLVLLPARRACIPRRDLAPEYNQSDR